MLSRVKSFSNLLKPMFPNNPSSLSVQPMSVLAIHKPEPKHMSHEECKENPILKKKGIQHPTISSTKCTDPECSQKVCKSACAHPTKTEAIAHGTHDPRYPSRMLSKTDLAGDNRPQYARFYKNRPTITEPEKTLDIDKTKELHSNKELYENALMYNKFHE